MLTVIHCFYFHEPKIERKRMNSIAQRMFVRGSISLLLVVTKEEGKKWQLHYGGFGVIHAHSVCKYTSKSEKEIFLG